MEPIVALSLFDGISCGQLALQRAGIPVSVYYASEIDKKAMAVTTKNFPNTVHFGIWLSRFNNGRISLPRLFSCWKGN